MLYFLIMFFLCIFETNSFFIEETTTSDGTTEEPFQSSKFYEGDYEHGYMEVREGAFMFWWLYYADGEESTAYDKPLVIWLQGGPGAAGSGIGIFLEIGPQDMQFQNRNHSWVKTRNVLFVDSPVGSGFSYVENDSLLVTTDEDIAYDLVELMRQFLEMFPKFEAVPTHIFSQSYGGKIAPIFAYYLHKGFLDQTEYISLRYKTRHVIEAIDNEQYLKARYLHSIMWQSKYFHDDVNIYNVLQVADNDLPNTLEMFMNTEVKNTLYNINSENVKPWLYHNVKVYNEMANDFMKNSTNFVEKLLNETRINLVVFNGQLDAITSLSGAIEWVHRLKWGGAASFREASQRKIRGSGNGFYKYHDQLSFWWIYKAGHSTPSDNPEAMEHILNLMVDSVHSVAENYIN